MKRIGFKEAVERLNEGYSIRLNKFDYTYRIVIDEVGTLDTEIGYITQDTFFKVSDKTNLEKYKSGYTFDYYNLNN